MPRPTEAELLLELVLPTLLEARADAWSTFAGTIHLEVFGAETRSWTLTGGARPWLRRGAPTEADLWVRLSSQLVAAALRDQVGPLERWVETGDLGVRGDPSVLERLGRAWEGARSILDVRSGR